MKFLQKKAFRRGGACPFPLFSLRIRLAKPSGLNTRGLIRLNLYGGEHMRSAKRLDDILMIGSPLLTIFTHLLSVGQTFLSDNDEQTSPPKADPPLAEMSALLGSDNQKGCPYIFSHPPSYNSVVPPCPQGGTIYLADVNGLILRTK
jgi:hypothetical protein